MLLVQDLITNAVKHFPRWMDIRKRYKKSMGGQLLGAVARETAEIQEEVDKYVKQFFIPFYKDKCDIIPSFIYKANIGETNIEELTLVDPEVEIITDIKEFYSSTDKIAYYQDGFIFLRDYQDIIVYTINEFKMEATLEKMHVWNAYDEFAAFIGIERYYNESNEELFNRIISTSSKVLNSSEQGLKNAIAASLTNIVPGFDMANIQIERPTAENLVKYYDEFETALDKLMKLNKDVLRTKSWDIDRWRHDFKQIDYIPHLWDVTLDEYVNGIGDNDDLKPILIDTNTKTDIELSFYKKSEETIDKYIKNKDIDETLNISLVKYNDILEPFTAKYKITASEALDIQEVEDNKDIVAVISEVSTGPKYRRISEIGVGFNNIEIVKTGYIQENKYYRVKFLPKSKYDSMEIYDLEVVDESGNIIVNDAGELLDLKREKGSFVLSGSTLRNRIVKKSVTKKSQFLTTTNVVDTGFGVTANRISEDSNMVLEINNCNGEIAKILYDCEMSRVLEGDIMLNHFFYNRDTDSYLSDIPGDEKNIIVNVRANQFKTVISRGQCHITAIINGKTVYNGVPMPNNGQLEYATERFTTPQDMQIIITAIGMAQVEVSELSYTNYDLIVTTSNGTIEARKEEPDLYKLPEYSDNNLVIVSRTRTQFAPVIRKIFVGRSLDNTDAYESDIVKGIAGARFSIRSNCDVELYESDIPFPTCDKNDTNQKLTLGFVTDNMYTATDNDAYIILDTSEYININSIQTEEGIYETNGTGKSQVHMIRLVKGQKISGVTIDGSYNTIIGMKTIHDLIASKVSGYIPSVRNDDGLWIEGDRLYVSKLLKCFVVERINGEQIQVSLDIKSFNVPNSTRISKIELVNLPESVEAAFITANDSGDKSVSIGSSYDGTFNSFYLYPKSSKEYIAKNEYVTYTPHREDIEIVNTFNNGYIDNMFMAYTIEPIVEGLTVVFDNNLNWTVGKKTITIDHENSTFNMTHKNIIETVKLGSMVNLKELYTTENKEIIELAQYIIDDEGKDYKAVYKHEYGNPSYEKAEFIDVKNDGFNKLRYSNIVEIKYFGTEYYDENEILNEIDPSFYELDKQKGIIRWLNADFIKDSPRLYIIYTIKKAIAIKYNLDSLYKKAQYPISAYKLVETVNVYEIENGQGIYLKNPILGNNELSEKISKAYANSDVIYARCKSPGFEVEKIEDNLLIKKFAETNTLAIKSGWYYMYGREYYMFATNQNENMAEDEYVTLQEVTKIDDELHLHKKTANFIKNSKMVLGALAYTYHIDEFDELEELKGSSFINSITACDNYNGWYTFGMAISLAEGLNGLGMAFKPYTKKDISYALLNITGHMEDSTHISFYNPDNLKVYIGKEKLINGVALTDTINISTLTEITSSTPEKIFYTTVLKEKNCKYYFVVRGEGLIDDIIIQDGATSNLELHRKNISTLNLDIRETTTKEVSSRMFINNTKGNKNNGTEINSEGYIVNASNIDWNVTKIKSYTSKTDWLSGCSLTNVNITSINELDCAAVTENSAGKIVTRPIYVGDPNTINSIIFKVNNLPLKDMSGFNMTLYQAQTANGPFMPCKIKLNSNSSLNYTKDLIYPYIQLSVEMPQKKVIDIIEIYAEHKSTERFSPSEKIESNGQFISKVLDSRYTATYKITDIGIEDVQGIVSLYVRASKENAGATVWTNWHKIELRDGKIANEIIFENYRFFQVKAELGNKNSKIKLKYIDAEVIK